MASAAKKIQAPFLGKSGTVDLDPAVFGEEFNGTLVHEVVRAERNAKRQGTASTKRRGEVAMTGAKAWRQKGTGRARIGAQSAGHRRGGGVTFGPKPRNYVFKVNRKARRKALRATLSLHAERGTIAIVEAGSYDSPSTKTAAGALTDWRDTGSVVVLTGGDNERDCALSFRNIDRVRAVLAPSEIGVAELAAAQSVVISTAALEELTRLAAPEISRDSKKPVEAATASKPAKASATSADASDASTTSSPSDSGDTPDSDTEGTE
jgi:large subunit ribosomal protein L4